MATQEEIAKAVGLSRSTVKAALALKPTISLSEETILRVKEAAARMNYRPNRFAQTMRTGKSGVVGVIHFGGVNQMAAQRSLAAVAAIQDAGYQCIATDVTWSSQRVHAAVSAALDAQVEGVLMVCPTEWMPVDEVQRLRQARVPVVAIAGIRLAGVPCVRINSRQGIADITRHLLGLGYKRLALMTSSPLIVDDPDVQWPTLERREGFKEAILAAGGALVDRPLTGQRTKALKTAGPIGELLSLPVRENWSNPYIQGYERMRALIAQGDLPQAVVCSNDDWVQGAMTACAEEGVRVPHDIALTGFDNVLSGGYGMVPITTAGDPLEEMAGRAMELLKRLMKGKKLKPEEQLVRLPCELIVRKSCGADLRKGSPQ